MEMKQLDALKKKYKDNGITHKIVDTHDIPNCDISIHFPATYDFIEMGLLQGNVMIHSFAGISRSTTLALSYLMKKQRKPWKKLQTSVKKIRPMVKPNLGFEKKLDDLQFLLRIS